MNTWPTCTNGSRIVLNVANTVKTLLCVTVPPDSTCTTKVRNVAVGGDMSIMVELSARSSEWSSSFFSSTSRAWSTRCRKGRSHT